jgi:PPM family protein phosphatase
MACDVISRNVKNYLEKNKSADRTQVMFGENNPQISEPANNLVSAVRLANRVIFEASRNYSQNHGMGTTLAALLAVEKSYIIAWVGDSRIYLVRHGLLQQLTTDHSLVQEQVNKGIISSDEAESSEFKNILIRALGTAAEVNVDAVETLSFEDDYLILCSDGLTRMVPDRVMLETVKKYGAPESICAELIGLANEAGGRDNITAIVISNKSDNFWKKFIKSVVKT